MLGKLLKYEFRASGRLVLPGLAVLTILVVLANVAIRLLSGGPSALVAILSLLVVFLAMVAVIAAEVIPLAPMIQRFHRNLLSSEGYLMHTLPVSVHSLVWSKLITSLVWMILTNLLLVLLGSLSLLHLSGADLSQILAGLPSAAELRNALTELGMKPGAIWLLVAEFILNVILAGMVICLHFYAAMSLGYMFTRRKGGRSVLFFVVIIVLFFALFVGFVNLVGPAISGEFTDGPAALAFLRTIMALSALFLLLQAGLLYLFTVLGLKKGLNLA